MEIHRVSFFEVFIFVLLCPARVSGGGSSVEGGVDECLVCLVGVLCAWCLCCVPGFCVAVSFTPLRAHVPVRANVCRLAFVLPCMRSMVLQWVL